MVALVIVTFIVEATGRESIVDAGQFHYDNGCRKKKIMSFNHVNGKCQDMTVRTRRDFLKSARCTVASLGVYSILSGCGDVDFLDQNSVRPPNVLLIMTDDQGWGDIRSHGNPGIDTPVMDKLADEGARFDRFFVSPVCAPTRASLLTGRYHLRCGTWGVTRAEETMRENETTIAEIFKRNGYVTGCFGKWHNGAHFPHNPNGQGFDEFLGFCAGHWNNYFDTQLEHNGRMVETKGYIADYLTDVAIRFIEDKKQVPFFCYVPYNPPHTPWQASDKYFDKYKARRLDDVTACAYAMCENLDDNIGRLLNTLDELGLRDDTIVLFLTDNGPNSARFNGRMKGHKGSYHEGGVRVPLFVRWPGHIEQHKTITQITSHIDILPTLVDLCGLRKAMTLPLDGISLRPLLEGKPDTWPDRMIFTLPQNADLRKKGAVRTQKWRAVKEGTKLWRLFDMEADPGQIRNVARHNPGVVKKLSEAYEKAFADVTKNGFDPIPVHIGYRDWPLVVLEGHEAHLEPAIGAGISYQLKSGWANDWITNWTDTNAYAWWPLKVAEPGTFDVSLLYVCAEENTGAKMRIEFEGAALEATIDKPHDPPSLPSPDRVPRKEVYEKVWASKILGTVELKKGEGKLMIKAAAIAGKQCRISRL